MADQTSSLGPVPELQNKVPKPPGVSGKNRQTIIMLAVGGLIALVIAFSNSSTPTTKVKSGKGGAETVNPTSPQSVQQYVRQLDEDAKSLAQERAHAEQMRTEAQHLQAGQQNPYQNPYVTAPAAMSANGSPVQHQISPEETEATARRKREQDALRASNIALSFRKDQPQATSGDRSAGSLELQDIRQLIDAQKAALAATFQPPAVPIRTVPEATAPAVARAAEAQVEKGEHEVTARKRQEDPALQKAAGKSFRLFEGTIIESVLENRLNASFSGPVDALVTTAVYSHDGEHVLIPQGSRIIGEVQRVSGTGQQRVAVAFHRLIMPDGFAISLDQFKGLNEIGETGLKDLVNQHYLQIFGASLALGAIAGVEQAGGSYGYSTSGVDVYRQGVSQSLATSATRILDRFLNVLPTITIREGHRIKVYLTDDLMLPAYESHRLPSDL
jgi:type IV secretion system protein VirB10